MTTFALAGVAHLVGASSYTPRGDGFDYPGFKFDPHWERVMEAKIDVSPSHWYLSFSH